MRQNVSHAILIFIILCSATLFAQPFTLDKNIKPLKLALKEHPKYEGAKYAEGNFILNSDSTNYHYVKGHDIYQFVDIFIYAKNGSPNLQADIVFNTWNNIEETKQTASSENGIINFKVRSYQDIGFTIKSPETNPIDYSIVVNASQPVMNYLGSPFVKATESNIDSQVIKSQSKSGTLTNDSTSEKISWWIYLIIGALLLLVGLLAGKLVGRKKTVLFIWIFFLIGITSKSYGQQSVADFREGAEGEVNNTRRGQIDSGIGSINDAFNTTDVAEELILQYRNLGSCLGTGSPPGQPRIPSFCPDEESSCASCFSSARANFNRSRYNLEKLQTIYDCSRAYIDAAIAFGDNVSGYHGVVGLVWQSKKRAIERSVKDLEKAYDKKRLQMLQTFNETLLELDECERAHGLEDWYDRFGVMFYNFVEMRYHR